MIKMELKAMKHRRNQKGLSLGDLRSGALAMVVLVIVIAVGAQILGSIQTTQTAGTAEHNTTTAGLAALETFGDWFGIIVLVIVAAVVLSIVLSAFARSSGGGV